MTATAENIEKKEVGQRISRFLQTKVTRSWKEKVGEKDGKPIFEVKKEEEESLKDMDDVNVLVPATMGRVPVEKDDDGNVVEEALGLQLIVRDGRTSRNVHVTEIGRNAIGARTFAGGSFGTTETIEGEGEGAVTVQRKHREIFGGVVVASTIVMPKEKVVERRPKRSGPRKSKEEARAERQERKSNDKKGKRGKGD